MKAAELKKMLRDSKPHHEGYALIKEILIWLLIVNGMLYFLQLNNTIFFIIATLSTFFFLFMLYFIRNPERKIVPDDDAVFSPVDGKVTSVEVVENAEFFGDKRLKISFHSSPLQLQVKRAPIGGKIISIFEGNGSLAEMVLETPSGQRVFIRQYGAFLRKFLFSLVKKEAFVEQGEEIGFLGSKLTMLLSPQIDVKVKVGDIVRANESVIAR